MTSNISVDSSYENRVLYSFIQSYTLPDNLKDLSVFSSLANYYEEQGYFTVKQLRYLGFNVDVTLAGNHFDIPGDTPVYLNPQSILKQVLEDFITLRKQVKT